MLLIRDHICVFIFMFSDLTFFNFQGLSEAVFNNLRYDRPQTVNLVILTLAEKVGWLKSFYFTVQQHLMRL